MALGTPVVAAAAYSAASGTTVSPAYPTGILTTDSVVLFVGMKPAAVGGGTVTTPAGWTLRDSLTNAGGYTAQGADTGNTNLYVYTWDSPVAGQTGTRAVTLSGNNVTWAFIVRVPTGGGTLSYGSADGQRSTAPSSPLTIGLTDSASPTNFTTGDLALWAMCIPTDVTTPAQFSNQSLSVVGATFNTAVEMNEPDSTTGNDIGGYSARATVASGTATTAPSVIVTLSGTITNVRGPVVMLRIREAAAPPAQTLTPSLYTNTQTFHNPTVTRGAVTLTPSLYTNDQTFYSADVTQTGGSQTLTPSLYTNTQSFFAVQVAATYSLTPARYDNTQSFFSPVVLSIRTLTPTLVTNTQSFFSPAVAASNTLTPGLVTNTQTFYGPVVGSTALLAPSLVSNTQAFYGPTVSASYALTPSLFTNGQTFYQPSASASYTISPGLLSNAQTFYSATVSSGYSVSPTLLTNDQTFYGPIISQTGGVQTLLPSLYTNNQEFFSASVSAGPVSLDAQGYSEPGYVDVGYFGPNTYSTQAFYAASVLATNAVQPSLVVNTQTFYAASIAKSNLVQPSLVENQQTFFSANVSIRETIQPSLYVNTQTFYAAAINVGPETLHPSLYTNVSQFYSPAVEPDSFVITKAQARLLHQIYKLNGLGAVPLNVNTTYRTAGDIVQSITEARNGTVTVQTTASDTFATVDPGQMIQDLAALYALTDTLQVTRTGRFVGTLSQSITTNGFTTVVQRLT